MNDLMFHFLPESKTLQYKDGREVRVGETLTVEGEPILCEHGLHASPSVRDALAFLRGPVLTVVRLGGVVLHADDKSVGTERTCLWMKDVSQTLRIFACDCAERALLREREAGREPDPRSWKAVEVARRFAAGEATSEELEEAWAAGATWASGAAAEAASWAAAEAAGAAAWAAGAAGAARAAAQAAAQAAAEAAWAAAQAAEVEWQKDHLMTLLKERDGLDLESVGNVL